ncbi:MAG: YncE family protein [Solirubrobacterales bacterium]
MRLRLATGLLAMVALGCQASAAAAAAPQQVGTISLPGGDPTSLGVYEPDGELYVSDDNAGEVRVFDGDTLGLIGTISGVGSSGFDMVVDQSLGRVYVASSKHPFTTGYNDGTGKVAVIDLSTNAVTEVDVPDQNPVTSNFNLAHDEGRDRVYVAHSGGFGYIDDTNTFHAAMDAPVTDTTYDIGINTVANEVYYATVEDSDPRLVIVDGDTLGLTFFDLGPTGAGAPLDFAVNEAENKVYVTMVFVPGQAEPGIMILDRDDDSHSFVGSSDLNPIAFNPATSRLFAGVQIGTEAGILEGSTDAFTEVKLPDGGIGGIDVNASSDNAYMASSQMTYVMNGSLKCAQRFPSGAPLRGGVVASNVAVNQATDRAFVVNDQEQAHVKVFQDGDEVVCPPPDPGLPPFVFPDPFDLDPDDGADDDTAQGKKKKACKKGFKLKKIKRKGKKPKKKCVKIKKKRKKR